MALTITLVTVFTIIILIPSHFTILVLYFEYVSLKNSGLKGKEKQQQQKKKKKLQMCVCKTLITQIYARPYKNTMRPVICLSLRKHYAPNYKLVPSQYHNSGNVFFSEFVQTTSTFTAS